MLFGNEQLNLCFFFYVLRIANNVLLCHLFGPAGWGIARFVFEEQNFGRHNVVVAGKSGRFWPR